MNRTNPSLIFASAENSRVDGSTKTLALCLSAIIHERTANCAFGFAVPRRGSRKELRCAEILREEIEMNLVEQLVDAVIPASLEVDTLEQKVFNVVSHQFDNTITAPQIETLFRRVQSACGQRIGSNTHNDEWQRLERCRLMLIGLRHRERSHGAQSAFGDKSLRLAAL